MGSEGDTLRRIILESLEVSFEVCNSEMEEYSCSKIFDVFDQILPTANVMNTAYWVYFSTTSGQPLCICGRFGYRCRHSKGRNHWVDVRFIPHHPGHQIFYPRSYGPVVPLSVTLSLEGLQGRELGYHIDIVLKLIYQRPESTRVRSRRPRYEQPMEVPRPSVYDQTFEMLITCSYTLSAQFYPPMATVVFHPNPFHHRCYSTLIRSIQQLRLADPDLLNMTSQLYCRATSQMPPTTFALRQTNVPVFTYPDRVSAVVVQLQDPRYNVSQARPYGPVYTGTEANPWYQYINSYVVHQTSNMAHAYQMANEVVDLTVEGNEHDYAQTAYIANRDFVPPVEGHEYAAVEPATSEAASGSYQASPPETADSTTCDSNNNQVDEETDSEGDLPELEPSQPENQVDKDIQMVEDQMEEQATVQMEAVVFAHVSDMNQVRQDWLDNNFPPLEPPMSYDETMDIVDSVIRDHDRRDREKSRRGRRNHRGSHNDNN